MICCECKHNTFCKEKSDILKQDHICFLSIFVWVMLIQYNMMQRLKIGTCTCIYNISSKLPSDVQINHSHPNKA